MQFQLCYGNYMSKFGVFYESFQNLGKLTKVYGRPPNDSFKKETNRISHIWKLSVTIVIVFSFVAYFLNVCFMNDDTNILVLVVKGLTLNRPKGLLGINILLYGIMMPHSLLFEGAFVLLSLYFNLHFKYLLRILRESIEIMVGLEKDFDDETEYWNSNKYQKHIKNEMKYFLAQYIRIKM